MTAPERAPLGAALALLLTVVSLAGAMSPVLMAVTVALMSLMIAIAWPDLLELPSPLGTRIVVGTTGIAGAALVLLGGEMVTPTAGIVMVCAAGVLAAFGHQMLRRERHQLTESLSGTVAGVMVTGVASCWVLAQSQAESASLTGLVTAIAAGVTASLLLDATPLPSVPRLIASLLAGTGVTVLLATSLSPVSPLIAAGVGLIGAVGASGAHLLLGSSLVAREPAPSIAVAAGPVTTVGVLAHVAVTLLA